MGNQQSQTRQFTRTRQQEPTRFRVIMHNDNVTTMDFVVLVLRTIFFKNQAESERLMLTVHHKGEATVGVYVLDVAQSKVALATDLARKEGFPLRLTIQPE